MDATKETKVQQLTLWWMFQNMFKLKLKVNCPTHQAAEKFKVDGYPTLKFFNHGQPSDYSGPRYESIMIS